MILVLLGPPGAGKGTQAAIISDKAAVPQISTGDILRAAVKDETKMGLKAKGFMDAGGLVPDEVVVGIIRDRIAADDCKGGFILDGFPRTIGQAEALDAMLKSSGLQLDNILDFIVEEESLVERLTGRMACNNCGFGYHIRFSPPVKEGKCDKCGGELGQRADDNETTVRKRFDVYKQQSEELKAYYGETGKYAGLDGEQGIEKVSADVASLLGL